MGLRGVRRELASLDDLDEEIAEYLVSSLVDTAEDYGEPLGEDGVLEVIEPFVAGIGLQDEEIKLLAARIGALLATTDEPDADQQPSSPCEAAHSAQEARRAKLNAVQLEPEPEPEPEPELHPEPPEQEAEAEEVDQQLAFLKESFPDLPGQEIRQIIKQNRGQVDDRAFELLFQRQAVRAARSEVSERESSGAAGEDAGSRKLSEAEKREEAKRRRALLERYENSASAGNGGGRRKNGTGGIKTVHARLPTKSEAARQKAAEQKAKVRYHEGVVVTRTGEKYTPVPLTKEEEERERALKAATSVNLAYKTSKGRRHKGR